MCTLSYISILFLEVSLSIEQAFNFFGFIMNIEILIGNRFHIHIGMYVKLQKSLVSNANNFIMHTISDACLRNGGMIF